MGLNKRLKDLLHPNSTSSSSTVRLLDHPRYLIVDEGVHADEEPIDPKDFPWPKLVPLWSTLNPNTKNPRLAKEYTKGHHGANHGKKKKDFETFHFGFCLEYCVDEDGTEYRCMNQFQTDSNQCMDHPKTQYKDGPNKIWKEMKDGRSGNWGMINKVRPKPPGPAPPAKPNDELDWGLVNTLVNQREAAGENRQIAWESVVAEMRAERVMSQKIEKDEAREKTRKTKQAAAPEKTHKTGNTRNPKSHRSRKLAARDQPVDGNVPPPSRRRKQVAEGKGRSQQRLAPVDENTAPE